MSFVNVVLGRLLGSGIPHLLLDQLALRFELSAYQRLFARAARVWSAWPKGPVATDATGVPDGTSVSTTERLRHLMRMKSELNDFVSMLGNSMTLIEARALQGTHPHAAEFALLSGT
jgi:hypothetical protein